MVFFEINFIHWKFGKNDKPDSSIYKTYYVGPFVLTFRN